ncbi:MAG: thioredoxin domain-containing protein [Sciscionella sp.]
MGASVAAANVEAAIDQRAPLARTSTELLVFQVANCAVCDLVHTHIRPAYQRSAAATETPMRFIDVNSIDESSLGLAQPISIVPTIVLMREGREVDRLTGYTGTDIFFEALEGMLKRLD